MPIKKSIFFIFLLYPAFLLGAQWEEHGIKIMETGSSVEDGSRRYTLRDDKGRTFEVNYSSYPEQARRSRVIALKDLIYAWKNVSPGHMEFFFAHEGIYANILTKKIAWKGENLIPYLPAGLAFHDAPDALYYRFRIVVKDISYKLEGKFHGEEEMLNEIISFILTVKEEKLAETDLEKYRIDEHTYTSIRDKEKEKIKPRISINACGNYLMPTGGFSRAYEKGYGGMAGVTLHGTGFSLNDRILFYLDYSLSIGYWRFKEKEDPDPDVTGEVKTTYIIPLILSVHYPIKIWRGLFLAPSIGVGYNYNHLSYERNIAGIHEEKTVKVWTPSLSAGLRIGYPLFNEKIIITGSCDYMALFERERNNTAFLFYAGAGYLF